MLSTFSLLLKQKFKIKQEWERRKREVCLETVSQASLECPSWPPKPLEWKCAHLTLSCNWK